MVVRAAAAILDLCSDERARSDLVDATERIERTLPDARAKRAFRAGGALDASRLSGDRKSSESFCRC